MSTEKHQEPAGYWLSRFREGKHESSFPPDHRREESRKPELAATKQSISPADWAAFAQFCEREKVEKCHAVVALLQVLLHRYTVADTVEIGVQMDSVFPVRTEISSSSSLRENLAATALAISDAEVNACSWEQIRKFAIEAASCPDKPLFRLLLCLTDNETRARPSDEARATCELLIHVCDCQAEPEIQAEYDSQLYNGETVDRILAQLAWLIVSFESVLPSRVDRIPLCSPEEAKPLIQGAGANEKQFARTVCVHRRFEEQVRKSPDAIALVMPGEVRQQLTYAQLNERANKLAHFLQSKGIGPDVLVGLYLERTPDLMVALLAILKAGGAYLPIDLSYPPDRVSFMLTDSEAPIVITDSKTAQNVPQTDAAVIRIDADEAAWEELSCENPSSDVRSENLIYCIFTSGSTGKPKGVLITHANVSRLFDATDAWFHFDERDTWTFFHSSAFDFSVWEIWGALIYGGRLVLVPFADSRSPERFYDILADEQVTVLNQTPSAFRQLLGVDERRPNQRLDGLRLVIFGGEALNLQSLAPWFSKYGDLKPQLVNMYGITETTVHVTYRPLTKVDLAEAPGSVIGVPIPDLQLYVLDPALQPVPVGVPGEIYVGGAGVARGYLKRDELTASRFIDNPFCGGKLYKTGDLARRLDANDLEYLGRADHQVKIRGFRIELGEVQAALTKQSGVREAFVTAKGSSNGEKVLVAYVVPMRGESPAVDKLRRSMEFSLPVHMVPSHFVFLEKLPLTSNGKIDWAALPEPRSRRSDLDQQFLAPQNDLERNIAQIYKDALKIDAVGIDDNFFDLGGNSLKLAEVHARLQTLIGRDFSVAELFAHTTIRKLAAFLSRDRLQAPETNEFLNRAQRQRQAMAAGKNRVR